MKAKPLNCTFLCKVAKIGRKYVTIETVEKRDWDHPDGSPSIIGKAITTRIDIAHNGEAEETVCEYRNQLIRDRKRGYDDFFPSRFVGALNRERKGATIAGIF